MKNIGLYMRISVALMLLQFSYTAAAFELNSANIKMALREASNARYSDPLTCITQTKQYIEQQKHFKVNSWPRHSANKEDNSFPIEAIQLLSFCYTQLENYDAAINILLPLLQRHDLSANNIGILNLIALTIPQKYRPTLPNSELLGLLIEAETELKQPPYTNSSTLSIELLFSIVKLSLQENQYQQAINGLEEIKKRTNDKKNIKYQAWLSYFYGVYYDQINQSQLANSAFLQANKQANKHNLIELSGVVKKRLIEVYRKKYRLSIAMDFAKQRIELYLDTKNNIKQADSLIELAVLKRQKKQNNQSLIHLFNALELIHNNKHSVLLAHIYLEIGRTYLSSENDHNHLLLAQKYLQNARYHFKRLNYPRYQFESLLLLAKLNIINKDPALAIIQLEKILDASDQQLFSLRVQAFEMLALSYELTGNLQLAILHFKNFHALQNRIKQRLLELQQLQISEQLQLFEKTQNQEQLEAQNTQLQEVNSTQRRLAHSALLLLLLVSILYFYTLNRNKNLNRNNRYKERQLGFHKRTKLPLQYARQHNFSSIYTGDPLYYALLHLPFLNNITELKGVNEGNKIEHRLGVALKKQFMDNMHLFQLRDNQILLITQQSEYYDVQQLVQTIQRFFESFTKINNIESSIACGVVAFPFLSNAPRAISATRTLKLSALAMSAANQIRLTSQESSWVELTAIDNLQPAFLDGDLWRLGQVAVDKGLIKINSSQSDFIFTWPIQNK